MNIVWGQIPEKQKQKTYRLWGLRIREKKKKNVLLNLRATVRIEVKQIANWSLKKKEYNLCSSRMYIFS